MFTKHWDKAIYLKSSAGEKLAIRNIPDAENYLLSDWHRFEPRALQHAIMACLLSTADNASVYDARVAFENAASVSGILHLNQGGADFI
ncbi:DUF982 domain-containing protein [Pseudochrobactrum sp. MP213Fo]|uniref:DUF982 domain-containing protein n=1 Tax=Pseudochrobactrum sp. MP213Fo TaxID=3022250 RepID=UPI003BA0F537